MLVSCLQDMNQKPPPTASRSLCQIWIAANSKTADNILKNWHKLLCLVWVVGRGDREHGFGARENENLVLMPMLLIFHIFEVTDKIMAMSSGVEAHCNGVHA